MRGSQSGDRGQGQHRFGVPGRIDHQAVDRQHDHAADRRGTAVPEHDRGPGPARPAAGRGGSRAPGHGRAPAHPHERDRRRHLHRHRPRRRLRRALRRPARPSLLGVPAGQRLLLLQQRLGPARPDHRGARRPLVGRLAAGTAVSAARLDRDRHAARGGDLVPGRGRAPGGGRPGPVLGTAAQRRPGGPDHRLGARPAHVRPVPPGRRAGAGRQAATQRGVGHGYAAAADRDPGHQHAWRGHRAGLADLPLGRPYDHRARRRHHRPVGVPAGRPADPGRGVPADQLRAVQCPEAGGIRGGVRVPGGSQHARGAPADGRGRGGRRSRPSCRPLRAHVPPPRRGGP